MLPGAFYHIYNRANGSEKLFLSDENYRYFLRRYQNFIAPIAHTYCYCLMPNHFHFLIEVKDERELEAFFLENNLLKSIKTLSGLQDLKGFERENYLSKQLSLQFSHLFNSYSQAFNKQQKRKGSLFMKPFKRLRITDEKYLLNLVRYIHQNPVDAGLCFKPDDWEHSSYHHIIGGSSDLLDADRVIEWFGDRSNFTYCHGLQVDIEMDL